MGVCSILATYVTIRLFDVVQRKPVCREYYQDGDPWFMICTPIGDIKIGWRKRVINITFMENFAPFSMEIFAQEDVTKCEENGQKTIHAWGYDKFYEYLDHVRKTVLPNEKRSSR